MVYPKLRLWTQVVGKRWQSQNQVEARKKNLSEQAEQDAWGRILSFSYIYLFLAWTPNNITFSYIFNLQPRSVPEYKCIVYHS